MALNSRERRASAYAAGILAHVNPPLPNSAISAADRLQLLGSYSGLTIVIPDYVPPPVAAVAVRGRPTATAIVRNRPTSTVETPE